MLIIKSLLLGQRNPQYQQYDDLFFHLNLFPLFSIPQTAQQASFHLSVNYSNLIKASQH